MELRLARSADLSFIVGLAGQAFAAYGDYGRLISEWLSWPGILTTVAEANGSCAGVALLAVFTTSPARGADLLAIAVEPFARRSGLGGALLDDAVARSRRVPGITRLELTVAEENQPARRLFEGRGFRYVEGDVGSYPAGQKALRMRLLL